MMLIGDLLGRPLDVGDYVYNVNTKKTSRIVKITRKLDWRGLVRNTVVVRSQNGYNVSMSMRYVLKAVDAQGTISLEGLKTEKYVYTPAVGTATLTNK